MATRTSVGLDGFEHTEFSVPEGWYEKKLHKIKPAPVTLTSQELDVLKHLLGDEHEHVAQISNKNQFGHLTFLTKTNQEIQWLKDQSGNFSGIRLRHEQINSQDVRLMMKMFMAEGHSIELNDVEFTGTPAQQKVLRTAWETELKKMGPRPQANNGASANDDPNAGGPKSNSGGPTQGGPQPEEQGDLLLALTRAHSALLEQFKANLKTMSSAEKVAAIRKLNLADAVCCIVAGCKDESGISGKFTPAILAGLKKDLGDNRPGTNVPLSPNWESMAKRLNIHQGSTDSGPKAAGPKPEAPKNQAPPPPKAISGPQPMA